MLGEINVVTCSSQTRGYTLAECHEDLDVLIEAVQHFKTKRDSNLHQCKLGKHYIGPNSELI